MILGLVLWYIRNQFLTSWTESGWVFEKLWSRSNLALAAFLFITECGTSMKSCYFAFFSYPFVQDHRSVWAKWMVFSITFKDNSKSLIFFHSFHVNFGSRFFPQLFVLEIENDTKKCGNFKIQNKLWKLRKSRKSHSENHELCQNSQNPFLFRDFCHC